MSPHLGEGSQAFITRLDSTFEDSILAIICTMPPYFGHNDVENLNEVNFISYSVRLILFGRYSSCSKSVIRTGLRRKNRMSNRRTVRLRIISYDLLIY